MFTIGTFARLADVSVRTLRHYEEIGLITPDEVDPDTGYRFYGAHQIPRLHRIVVLKELGLTLGEIRRVLDSALDHRQLSDLLGRRRAELEERIASDQQRLARVEQRIRLINWETTMALDLTIKHIPATRVAQIRWAGSGIDWPEITGFGREAGPRLLRSLEAHEITTAGPLFLHYVEDGDGLVPTIAAPIGDQPLTGDELEGGIEVEVLPAIDAVVTVHHGSPDHAFIGPIYSEMAQFADSHGHRPLGCGRDHIVAIEHDQVVFELQLPLQLADQPPATRPPVR